MSEQTDDLTEASLHEKMREYCAYVESGLLIMSPAQAQEVEAKYRTFVTALASLAVSAAHSEDSGASSGA